jgi:biotin operon repressor
MKKTTHYTGHRWTDDELKNLMQMWANEIPLKEIATNLHSTTHAVLKQVQRMRENGIPLKRRTNGNKDENTNRLWTQGEMEYLLRRREEKASNEQISIELNRTWQAVQAMILKLRKENVDVKMRGQGVRRLWDVESLRVLQSKLNKV